MRTRFILKYVEKYCNFPPQALQKGKIVLFVLSPFQLLSNSQPQSQKASKPFSTYTWLKSVHFIQRRYPDFDHSDCVVFLHWQVAYLIVLYINKWNVCFVRSVHELKLLLLLLLPLRYSFTSLADYEHTHTICIITFNQNMIEWFEHGTWATSVCMCVLNLKRIWRLKHQQFNH